MEPEASEPRTRAMRKHAAVTLGHGVNKYAPASLNADGCAATFERTLPRPSLPSSVEALAQEVD